VGEDDAIALSNRTPS